jgi:uncharacterized protein YecA (UPF0149 family)
MVVVPAASAAPPLVAADRHSSAPATTVDFYSPEEEMESAAAAAASPAIAATSADERRRERRDLETAEVVAAWVKVDYLEAAVRLVRVDRPAAALAKEILALAAAVEQEVQAHVVLDSVAAADQAQTTDTTTWAAVVEVALVAAAVAVDSDTGEEDNCRAKTVLAGLILNV